MATPWDDFTRLMPAQERALPPGDLLNPASNFVPLSSKLNFERRILNPSSSPFLTDPSGDQVTHKMAWDDSNGRYLAFPTVVQDQLGILKDLGDDAYNHALKTGEFREFKTAKEAEDYARGGYKNQWGANDWSILEGLKRY